MSEPALLDQTVAPRAQPALRVVPHFERPALAPPTPRLDVPAYDIAAALRLERELAVSHTMAQVLVRRGLTDPAAARSFLHPREEHDPLAFDGIEKVLETIERHLRSGGRITIHGDYDVDGVCATAIMVRALRGLGGDVGWILPRRIDDGYGLSLQTVRRLAARQTDLLITVDCAITAIEEIGAAHAAGIEVVVCDHHAPSRDGILPDAPILHPSVCRYPFEGLCGTAVAYKLAQAMGAESADHDLDLVALATVADLMPLQGENRRLVRQGLAALSCTSKAGLRALMAVSRTDPSDLDAHALAFRLAPRINAAGRLHCADAGLELLLTEDEGRAAEIASELDALNAQRRALEDRICWEAEEQACELGDRRTLLLAGEGWHPGVIGIVAARIVERHHRPAVLVAIDGEIGTGSGRSIPGFDLLEALHASSEHLEHYGGHRAAAGMTVRPERIDDVRQALEAHAEGVLDEELLHPLERVDAIVCGSRLGLALAEELESLEPTGIGNPGARLLVPGARFGNPQPMGEGRHARFSVSSGGAHARAVAFRCQGRLPSEPGQPVDATFRLERNAWNGSVEARLVLRHAHQCLPQPITVLGEPCDFLAAALSELDASLDQTSAPVEGAGVPWQQGERNNLDRRRESPLAVLADAMASSTAVLALCADVPRRIDGLSRRIGGFALAAYHALEREPQMASRFDTLVALDPPATPVGACLLRAGRGFTHLAWGDAEVRFAQQMHELEYGLRASLAALYRSLELRGRVTGEELERLLRGEGPHGRPARLAGRLIRVLAELELVSLDRDLPALALASTAPTALERSAAYRAYTKRHQDGLTYLSSANLRPSG